jgi:probable DNA repair protein
VLPWTVWLRQEWLRARSRQSTGDFRRLLTPAQAQLVWEQIIAAHPLAQTLLNPSEAARAALRSWRRMQEYLIPLERLDAFDAPEARALRDWSREFIRRCDSLQAIDETRLLRWAWDVQLTPDRPLALLGFDVLPPAWQRLVERWQSRGLVRTFERAVPTTDMRVTALRDREAEIEAAARWARSQIERGKTNVAVVMPDLQMRRDDVRRRFEAVFTPAARGLHAADEPPPFIIAAPQPLAQFPVVHAALTFLQLVQGQANGRLAGRVLRSPFFFAADSERDARALADARLRREQRDRWDAVELERWAGVTGCTQLATALSRVTSIVRNLPRCALPSRWSEHFHALLRAIGWPGERPATSDELQTVRKFQACLAELGSLDAVLNEVTLARALHELERLAFDTPFEAETPEAAVTIIDPSTVAGMTFDAVWVTGLDASRMPGPTSPDPLIPLAVQREAGIPEANAELGFELSRVRLQRLMSSATEVVLSWPQSEGDAELQMSRLLAGLPQEAVAIGTSEPSWQHTIFAARPLLEVVVDDRAPAVQEHIARGGARTLELQSLCAFRAQATLRLRAEPLARIGSGLEPADRGKLLHGVLAAVWRELQTQQQLSAMSDEALEQRVRELAERQATADIPVTTRQRATLVNLAVEQTTQQVLSLLAIDRKRPPFFIRCTEQEELFTIGGLQLRLKLDRVDQLNAGCLVVDYKLGEAHQPRDWLDVRPGRPRKPQVPLYALAHRENLAGAAFAVLGNGTVEYRGWSNGVAIAPGIEGYPPRKGRWFDLPPDWNQLLERWQQTLTSLADRYMRGEAEVDPLPDACTYCHLSTFCRIHERDQRDAEEAGADDE